MPAPTLSSIDTATRYALSFDGVDDYVDVGNGASLQITGSITLEAWVKTSDSGGAIVSKFRDPPTDGYAFGISSSKLRAWFYGATEGYKTGTTNIANGNWHHLVSVYDSSASTIAIYVDGKSEGTATVGTPSITDSGNSVRIGNDQISGGVGGPLNGLIDEVRIWARALSATEVLASYQDQSVSRTGLVGEWLCDEGTGTNLADTSGSSPANDGTLTGGVAWKVKPPFITGISTLTF